MRLTLNAMVTMHTSPKGGRMGPNVVMSTVAGVAILSVSAAVGWGIKFGLELGYSVMGKSLGYVLAAPIVLFVAYLVGNGYLENKSSSRPRH